MAFDFNKLKKNLQKSAESIQQSVKEAAEKLPESVKEINISDSVKDLAQKSQEVVNSLKTKSEEVIAQQKEKTENQKEAVSKAMILQEEKEIMLPIRDSLRLFYCMMIVDGTISEEENERFDELGQELDPEFLSYRETIIEEGKSLMKNSSTDADEYYDSIHDQVNDIFQSALASKDKGIRGKLLLWNLLTIAYSEGEFSTSEKRLLRLITKKTGVDSAILLEMEQTLRTLLAIEKEETWLKNTDRSYAVVEDRINELEDRKSAIMLGVQALIAD